MHDKTPPFGPRTRHTTNTPWTTPTPQRKNRTTAGQQESFSRSSTRSRAPPLSLPAFMYVCTSYLVNASDDLSHTLSLHLGAFLQLGACVLAGGGVAVGTSWGARAVGCFQSAPRKKIDQRTVCVCILHDCDGGR